MRFPKGRARFPFIGQSFYFQRFPALMLEDRGILYWPNIWRTTHGSLRSATTRLGFYPGCRRGFQVDSRFGGGMWVALRSRNGTVHASSVVGQEALCTCYGRTMTSDSSTITWHCAAIGCVEPFITART